MLRLQLLIPIEQGKKNYYRDDMCEDSESAREEYIERAKAIPHSVVLVDTSHCSVKVLFENK